MKKVTLGLLLAGIALGGCATTTTQTSSGFDDDVDFQKVALIEHYAKQRGTLIRWVNYPQKKPS